MFVWFLGLSSLCSVYGFYKYPELTWKSGILRLRSISSGNLKVNMQDDAAEPAQLGQAIPGPWSIPGLGSPTFIWNVLSGRTTEALVRENEANGPLFEIKTGPIRQVWCSDMDMAARLYNRRECSGRSSLQEPVFGGDFLFLVRSPERATAIRTRQKALLAARSTPNAAAEAVAFVDLPMIISANMRAERCGGGESIMWPSQKIAAAFFEALIQLYVGQQPLSPEEVSQLLAAVARYRKRGLPVVERWKRFLGNLVKGSEKEQKLDAATEITELLRRVIDRSGVSDELLPLLVSATVGGGEIFPLLLRWIVLRLAADPDTQEALHASLGSRIKQRGGFTPLFPTVVNACALDCPVSAAIGPPRKIIEPMSFQGYDLPVEAIVFIMHPGLMRAPHQGSMSWPINTNVTGGWLMFGAGPRACPAAEQSLNFLSAALAELVRQWEWAPADPTGCEDMFAFEEDGSLLVPRTDTPLVFRRRPS